ncbi:MAG: VOC family protein [Candidatus Heimdallarchaeota archaeon]|nr:VOC family protein [Candidatus Heimdallarchaeota archaeon]
MLFTSQITFLYYQDLSAACKFYEKLFNFELTHDQGWAKIYKISEGAFLGLVDEKKGYFNWAQEKSAMVTLITSKAEEVDQWYSKLQSKGIKVLSEPRNVEELGIRCFLFEDPEGYVIEIQTFL